MKKDEQPEVDFESIPGWNELSKEQQKMYKRMVKRNFSPFALIKILSIILFVSFAFVATVSGFMVSDTLSMSAKAPGWIVAEVIFIVLSAVLLLLMLPLGVKGFQMQKWGEKKDEIHQWYQKYGRTVMYIAIALVVIQFFMLLVIPGITPRSMTILFFDIIYPTMLIKEEASVFTEL